jgi:uncharacterized membrane protein
MTRWGYLSLALVLASFGLAGYAHLNADAIPGGKIPIHWNIHGEPDGWASPDQPFLAFYLLPTMLGGVVALGLFALPWLSPRNFAVEGFRQTYDYVFFLVAALFLYLGGIITWSQFHGPLHLERTLLAGIFLFFALLGNVLGKVKRNFWMGVRTPWTLASETVWIQTHRLTAWIWTAGGMLLAILAFAGVSVWVWLAGLLVMALYPVIYSLWLYKRLEKQGRLAPP